MIYLDNAATSYPKPPEVSAEMDRCMKEYCANPGRGGHSLSITSGKAVMEARDILSELLGISNPMQLCFTKNATEGLNIAIRGILTKGSHVVTTCMEHNSVLRPLKELERNGWIELTIVRGNDYGEIDVDDVRKSIRHNSQMIISTLSSNVNGIIMPVEDFSRLAAEYNLLFLLDASQGAGSIPLDINQLKPDLVAFPGHKGLMGPQGTGGLFVREGVNLRPLLTGGTGSNSESMVQPDIMPDLLESGTLNTPGIVGLGAGAKFIRSTGIKQIREHKWQLVKRLQEGIEEIKGVRLYSRKDFNNNSGIVAMNFLQLDSSEASYVLDKNYGIATRAGLHCAPLAHETLGTLRNGILRFSVGYFNTLEEIDITLSALREIHGKVSLDN